MLETSKKFSTPVLIALIIFADVLQALPLMLLSGNFLWIEMWIYLLIFTIFTTYSLFWLRKNNPQLLESRTSMKGSPRSDKIILSLLGVVFIVYVIVVGLDGGRFHWSVVPVLVKILGFIGVAFGLIIMFQVMKENAFASKVLRVDKEGGQKVISTGPYAIVRHPMYIGYLLMFFGLTIALGSLFGLIPTVIVTILIIIRIPFEEKLLHEGLEGYTEYTEKVKYRLIPKIW